MRDLGGESRGESITRRGKAWMKSCEARYRQDEPDFMNLLS
jgi:hypothetical protein